MIIIVMIGYEITLIGKRVTNHKVRYDQFRKEIIDLRERTRDGERMNKVKDVWYFGSAFVCGLLVSLHTFLLTSIGLWANELFKCYHLYHST